MLEIIEADLAQDLLLRYAAEPEMEEIPLAEGLGRVLAQDIHVRIPLPPFDRSSFDGYAFRSASLHPHRGMGPVHILSLRNLYPQDFDKQNDGWECCHG